MAAIIYRQGIYRTETQESYEVETRGYTSLMPRDAQRVEAIFGQFIRLDNGHLLYTTSAERCTIDECQAAYTDDLAALKVGNVARV